MRSSEPIHTLISPIKMSILAATYGQPERWWYLTELATFIGRTPSSLQRDLSSMAKSGLLSTRKDGRRVYFRAETDSPLYIPLSLLIERSLGVERSLQEALKPYHDKIDVAFIYGSSARGDTRAKSDVDVIVIGRLGLADIAPSLRRIEQKVQREINVKLYSPDEFRSKVKKRNHFLIALLSEKKIFIIGSENVLERICGKRISKATSDK